MKRSVGLILVLALSLLNACGDDGEPAEPPLTSADLLQPGPYGVGVTTMTFEDTSRPTMPNGDFPGSPTRVLQTEIWYPAAPNPDAPLNEQRDAPLLRETAPYPVLLLSHAFIATPRDIQFVSLHFGSHGYIVAGPTFPLTRIGTPGGPNILDTVEQPGDLSFVIERLLELNGDAGSGFFAAVDPERIGLTGWGNGAFTTYLTAFHPTLRDPRIRAAAPMGNSGQGYTESFFDNAGTALLILDGDLNAFVPYEGSVTCFAQANPPKYLATVLGGTVIGFVGAACPLYESFPNTDQVSCMVHPNRGQVVYGPELFERLGGAEAGLTPWDFRICSRPEPWPDSIRPCRQHQLTILALYSFFEAYLSGDEAAKAFLENGLVAENADIRVQFDTADR